MSVKIQNFNLRKFLGISLLVLNSAFCFLYFGKFQVAANFIYFVQPSFYPPFLLFFFNYIYSIGLTIFFIFFQRSINSESFEKIIRLMSYSCSIGFLIFFILAYVFFNLLNPYRKDNSIEKVVKLTELVHDLGDPKSITNLNYGQSKRFSEALRTEPLERLMKIQDFRSHLCHLIKRPFGITIGFPLYSIVIWTLYFYLMKD